jgi:PAS domain S-box-containing protein
LATSLQNEVRRLRQELARAQVANATLGPAQLVASEAASELDLSAYLADVLRRATAIVAANAGSLLLLDKSGEELEFAVVHGGGGDGLIGKRIPADAGVAGWCLRQGRPLVVNDPAQDNRFYTAVDRQTSFETTSLICVPLVARGKPIGVLEALNKEDGRPFSSHDISLLWAFASQVALAIGRKQAEEALRRERDFVTHLVDAAPVVVLVLDADGRVERTNPYFERLCGYNAAALAQADWVSLLVCPRERHLVEDLLASAALDDDPQPVTIPILAQDGSRREVEWRARPLRDASAGPAGTLAIGLDITQRNQDGRLQAAIYEIAQAAVDADDLGELSRFIHAIITRMVRAPSFAIAVRHPPAVEPEYVYSQDDSLPPGQTNPYLRAVTAEVLRTGRPFLGDEISVARLLPAPAEAGIPASTVAVPLRLKAGTLGVLALYSYQTSITYGDDELRILSFVSTQVAMTIERKLFDEAARANEERWQMVVRANDDGIWDWSLRTGELFVSERWKRMHGCTAGDHHTGSSVLTDHAHPDDVSAIRQALTDHLAGETDFYRLEHRVVRPDGSVIWVLDRGKALFDANGTATRLTGSSADISDRKQAEGDLRQLAAELARSNADLEQFAYAASHDLQEPLRTVSGFVQLLAKRYQGQLDADADQFLYYITDAATRMQALIDDLLTYSRVQTRAKEPRPVSAELPLLRAVAALQGAIADSGAEVTHDPLPVVNVDASQLARLFQNLIGNAIKFRADRPCRIHVRADGHSDGWLFTVRDNGIGFDPQFGERIFQMFQRLHTRAEYPGSGMGLAICRKIVERHGGRMWAESGAGEGAVFYFTLPTGEAET